MGWPDWHRLRQILRIRSVASLALCWCGLRVCVDAIRSLALCWCGLRMCVSVAVLVESLHTSCWRCTVRVLTCARTIMLQQLQCEHVAEELQTR